ncbi:cytochrome oxidase putative small subunit CydP [Crenothrix sp.]|uniref:cytochrome oxidase putative small subunit CydP n=1 Tax=Crenothrix sp. TaxID=3100433 RepID=UPI00374D457D
MKNRKTTFRLEITSELVLKFMMLAALWWLFFAGNKPVVDAAVMADKLFGEQHSGNSHLKNQEHRP